MVLRPTLKASFGATLCPPTQLGIFWIHDRELAAARKSLKFQAIEEQLRERMAAVADSNESWSCKGLRKYSLYGMFQKVWDNYLAFKGTCRISLSQKSRYNLNSL